ncbi:SurA N-terminal domain-containing protein [Tautonia rosea]|uniref:hypothetical protein n=1 Tax=Tautonia rosea TaxID=2728037 RepID=UPI001472CE05|nr:hypothetical protein [Tautonia rosea]
MRVWPLIAALTLTATGCAGLDLSGFDDEQLAWIAANSSSPIEPAASDPTGTRPHSPVPIDASPELYQPLPPPEPVEPLAPPQTFSPIRVPQPSTPTTPSIPEPSTPNAPRDASGPVATPRPLTTPEPVEPPQVPEPVESLTPPDPVEPRETDQPAAPVEPLDAASLAPAPTIEPPSIPEATEPVPQPPTTILASQTTPVEPAEPRELAMFDQIAGEVEQIAQAEAPRNFVQPVEPAPPQGTVIATVGPQAITLPELTQAIKDRIARLPGRQRPTRRLVISMVQAEMEARILESLVLQQARVILDSPSELEDLRATIARSWSDAELPRILQREGFASADAFDARLRKDGQSLDDLRSAYTTRALARELMRREGRLDQNIDSYLNHLRTRFPIQSDLAQARRAMAR